MKVLVVGSGGREHAIAWKMKQSPRLKALYCAPGNAGTSELATNIPTSAEDLASLLEFALSRRIDLTVVGPEAPLVAGIVDQFQQAGLAIAGPSQAAARLEGSKAFAKKFMTRYKIPTASYDVFEDPLKAEKALKEERFSFPVVLKADGLAAGKGVVICRNLKESLGALELIMRKRAFGEAGARLVIEEFLEGEEASFMVFSDGNDILPMVPSQDHKAIHEGDQGPNTGGMGAYSTDAILSPELRRQILDEIIDPAIQGMQAEGHPYRGILYAGLMLTPAGPRVLEFNVRLGDPEAQVVLPRMETDLLEVLQAIATGSLANIQGTATRDAVVCVVVASTGYPGWYEKGKEISGLEMVAEDPSVAVFHGGTSIQNGRIVTSGGRVLGITAWAPTLESAIMKAYEGVNKIHFDGMYYRRDIAAKGLKK